VKRISALLLLVCSISAVAAAQSAAAPSPAEKAKGPQWSIQVERIDPGDIALEPSFAAAIYENLLDQLEHSRHFKQVLRSGDRNASDVPNLLTLRTTILSFAKGSETQRAVTTVSGSTRIKVHNQLLTRDGKAMADQVVEGDVYFLGSNLRATYNLARKVASTLKKAKLPAPEAPAPAGVSN
jgi:hypothetical protein